MALKIIIYILFCFSICAFNSQAQIGIGTDTPQRLLHIDANKTLVADDVAVDGSGNLTIGGIPSWPTLAKLTVQGTVKIVDGTQAASYGLISDANGLAHWGAVKFTVRRDLDNMTSKIDVMSTVTTSWLPTGGYLTVNPGNSIIRTSFALGLDKVIPQGAFFQIRYSLSTRPNIWDYDPSISPTGPADGIPLFLNSGENAYGYATATGIYPSHMVTGSGFWVVNNPTNSPLRLYLFYTLWVHPSTILPITVYSLGIDPSVPEASITISDVN